jgi:hypothetical protein
MGYSGTGTYAWESGVLLPYQEWRVDYPWERLRTFTVR